MEHIFSFFVFAFFYRIRSFVSRWSPVSPVWPTRLAGAACITWPGARPTPINKGYLLKNLPTQPTPPQPTPLHPISLSVENMIWEVWGLETPPTSLCHFFFFDFFSNFQKTIIILGPREH
jgi:hypothetical protein